MTSPFAGKSVIITGAARGFGRLTAERLAAAGAKLVIADVLEAELNATAEALRETCADVVTAIADVGEEATGQRLVDMAVKTYGQLDIAINNAGISHKRMRLAELDTATMQRVLQVNLMGTFFAMRAQIPAMEKAGGGAIVNLASAAGIGGAPTIAAYAASKHGVVGLTKSAAVEYARRNIRINAVCPSFAATPMVLGKLEAMGAQTEEETAKLVSHVPMRRLGTPDEVVEAILFATSPTNSFMTGQTISVDGGLNAM